MRDRPVEERIKDFDEVDRGLSLEEAMAEAERCLQCKKPMCVSGCPIGIDIPEFVRAVAEGEIDEAARIIEAANMLPAICGRVCPQEVQCEGECVLGRKEAPLAIGQLERFVADEMRRKARPVPKCKPPTGKSVAVIGSGPAGIVAASELARAGHHVTIFESLHEPGGVLMYGIPSFRLPKEIVREEVSRVLALGVDLRLNHLAGRSVTLEELRQFDAVFIATGAGLPRFLGIDGENLCGVYSANEFLTRVNLMHADRFPEYDTPVKRGARVAVIGGGNVAMDAARVSIRLGSKVYLIYRRREEDLPARKAEIERAREEGVEFITCANPVRIIGDEWVNGIECVRMEMCELDKSGRPVPRTIEGSRFMLDVDAVIVAIGQGPNPLFAGMIPDLRRGKEGTIEVDGDGQSSVPKFFAAGDITTGAATVILAMGAAKKAAASLDRMLSGDEATA
ncbi:MAG: NADPH-dependent glutamate synthase [Methanomicrobiales archaeon]|nr:NADPH-dependent glutamate synthase [Methanomicrobiales archaeon]